MKAFNLSRVDKEYDMHLQAWLNSQVDATKNIGSDKNPKEQRVFKKFDDFFNYKGRLSEVEGTKDSKQLNNHQKKLANIAVIANKKGG